MPKFEQGCLIDKEAHDGESITFTATLAAGSEPLEIVWLHDNCEIKDSPAFRYERDEKDISLIIADAFPEDSGMYTCTATNKLGHAEIGCTLTVKGMQRFSSIDFTAQQTGNCPQPS